MPNRLKVKKLQESERVGKILFLTYRSPSKSPLSRHLTRIRPPYLSARLTRVERSIGYEKLIRLKVEGERIINSE